MYEANLIFSVFLWLAVCIVYGRSKIASIYHPITYYLFFHGLVFALRPLFQYYLDYNTIYELYQFYPTEMERNVTLLIADLGMLCFVVACANSGNLSVSFGEKMRADQARPLKGPVIIAFILAAPLMIISFRYALSTHFSSVDLVGLTTGAHGQSLYTNNTAYIVDANIMLGSFAILIAYVYNWRWWTFIPILTFIILRLSIGWGRWSFVMSMSSMMLVLLFEAKSRWPKLKYIVIALVIYPLFNIVGEHRAFVSDLIQGKSSQEVEATHIKRGPFDSMDFANLEYLQYVVHVVPELTGTYNYFAPNLEILTDPVPRMFWPGKPLGSPVELYNLNDYGTPIGISWTVVGEGWQSLGVVGVAIWTAGGGWLLGMLYKWFVRRHDEPFVRLAYFLLIPLSVQWFRDGLLITAFKFPLFFVLPLAIVFVLTKFSSQNRRGPRGRFGVRRPWRASQIPLREPSNKEQ